MSLGRGRIFAQLPNPSAIDIEQDRDGKEGNGKEAKQASRPIDLQILVSHAARGIVQ